MAANPDDERLGIVLKAIRRRTGHTQVELARLANVPVRDLIAIEAGRCGDVRVNRVRAIFQVVDGRARLVTWWRGAAADRLLDERHAGLVEQALRVFRRRGWETAAEVSFSRYGEHGSIDILALHRPTLAIAVGEVKGSIGSLEGMNRTLDVKERLAPEITFERFGCRSRMTGRLLILPEDRGVRRIIDRHGATLDSIYPARSREVRAWLRRPDRPLRGIWFLSDLRNAEPVSDQ